MVLACLYVCVCMHARNDVCMLQRVCVVCSAEGPGYGVAVGNTKELDSHVCI